MSDNHINYIEFKANNLGSIEKFYSSTFGWNFTYFGPNYIAFNESGIEGGFEKTDKAIINGALVVLYHNDIETALEAVKANGGQIVEEIFSFPGGKRFHFTDPAGNELAIWSEK